jgi:hypothetical protein
MEAHEQAQALNKQGRFEEVGLFAWRHPCMGLPASNGVLSVGTVAATALDFILNSVCHTFAYQQAILRYHASLHYIWSA